MTCSDCGQPTLSDGVCIDCINKRIDNYPSLLRMVTRLKEEHNRLIGWKHEFSLQNCGQSQLTLTNYCLTGDVNKEELE